MMATVYLGRGANLGDPIAAFRAADRTFSSQLDTLRLAPFYRTAPVGPADQPDFCNAVTGIATGLEPLALLDALQAIEAAAGRVRTRRWGPRTLDLDILLYGERRIAEARLTVPHPRLHERAFVLVPLAALAPDAYVSGRGRGAALAAAVGDGDVEPWEAA